MDLSAHSTDLCITIAGWPAGSQLSPPKMFTASFDEPSALRTNLGHRPHYDYFSNSNHIPPEGHIQVWERRTPW